MAVNQINILQQENEGLRRELETLWSELGDLVNNDDKLREMFDKSEIKRYNALGITSGLYDENKAISERAKTTEADLKNQNAELRLVIRDLKAKVETLQKENKEKEGKIKNLEAEKAQQNKKIEELAKQVEGLLKENGGWKDERKTILAQLYEEKRNLEAAQEENRTSSWRQKVHAQQARADQLEEDLVVNQCKLEEEIKIKESVINQLQHLNRLLGDTEVTLNGNQKMNGRTLRKFAEHENKRANNERERANAAEREIKDLNERIEYYFEQLAASKNKLEVLEGKLNEDDIKAIFNGFGINYGVKLEKGEREDLYNAVKKAEKLDVKKANDSQRNGFDAKIERIVKNIQDSRDTEAGKNAVTKERIVFALEEQMQKPSIWRAFSKGSGRYKLAVAGTTIGALIVAASIALSAALPGRISAERNVSRLTTENALVYEISDMNQGYGQLMGDISGYYNQVETNNGYLNKFEKTDEIADDMQNIAAQHSLASGIVAYNDAGEIDPSSKLGAAAAGYMQAVEKNNKETATTYYQQIEGYNQEMAAYADSSSTSLENILDSLGITPQDLEDYNAWKEAQANPVIEVAFAQNDVSRYSNELISNRAGFKGEAVSVASARYVKETGAVTLVVECTSKYGEPYINVITFNMEKGRTSITNDEIMTAAQALYGNEAIQATAAKADGMVTDAQGNNGYFATTNLNGTNTATMIVISNDGAINKLTTSGEVSEDVLIHQLIERSNRQYNTEFDSEVENG